MKSQNIDGTAKCLSFPESNNTNACLCFCRSKRCQTYERRPARHVDVEPPTDLGEGKPVGDGSVRLSSAVSPLTCLSTCGPAYGAYLRFPDAWARRSW